VRTPSATPVPGGGPHRIGRFELRRQLGKGGCGIVFQAFDPKLERDVALKIPRPEMLLSPEARRRLVREALAAAEFDHPNLVPVYETGEIGPICYIATAFCPGQTLGDWLDRQAFPVPVRQAARLLATIAEAVQHAHDRGVLHRDLKPNNVILQSTREDPPDLEAPPGSCQLRGEHFLPRVVDFGLAKLLERGGPSDTNTRQVLGTPKYMAPEQAQARHDDVGPTADVYALGVILYEMLVGCAPYEGASDVEVLRQSIEGHLKYPRHIRPEIPRDLEAICLKAMDRSPARRYRTSIDLADDLHRFLDGKPTLARPLNWTGRSVKWLRRNDQIVALAVVTTVAVVLLAVGGWYVRQTQQLKDKQERVAEEQAKRTQNEQQREYAAYVRDAFLAWRGGNNKAAAEAREAAARLARMGGELEDFPIRYLARLIQSERLHIACPAGSITALAVSDDGQRLASGHGDGTVAIWDVATGQPLGSSRDDEQAISRIAFAAGGASLITIAGRQDQTPRVRGWSITQEGGLHPNEKLQRALPDDLRFVEVALSGNTMYAASADRLHVIELADEKSNRSFPLPAMDSISCLALRNGDREVLVGTTGGKVLRYSSGLVPIGEGEVFSGPITAIAPASPGGGFAIGWGGNALVGTFPLLRRLPIPTTDRVAWVSALPNGGLAANEGAGRVVLVNNHRFSLSTGDVGRVTCGVATRDGEVLFTGGEDGIIRSWQPRTDTFLRSVRVGVDARAIAIDPDGLRLMVSSPAFITDYVGSPRETRMAGPDRGFVALRIPAEGPAWGVEFRGRSVIVRNPAVASAPPTLLANLPDETTPVSAHISDDGNRLAVGDDRGRVIVWSLAKPAEPVLINLGTNERIERVALSLDGKRIAALTRGGIVICSVDEPAGRVTVPGDEHAVFRFLPTGLRLAIGDRSGVVRVWSVDDAREEAAYFGHVGRVTGIGISPDGRTIVSGGATGEVRFWDTRTGQELMGFTRHSEPVTVIEFARNGKWLVTGGPTQIGVWEAAD
jgi:WD40 repeat protein